MDLQYQWFQQSKPVGKRMIFELEGDLYIMLEKQSEQIGKIYSNLKTCITIYYSAWNDYST